MTDIETLAKRIILIGHGKVLYDGKLKQLKTKYGSFKEIKLTTNDKITLDQKGIINISKILNGYKIIFDSNYIATSNIINDLTKKYNISDIEIENENIDSVILKLYEDFKIWKHI